MGCAPTVLPVTFPSCPDTWPWDLWVLDLPRQPTILLPPTPTPWLPSPLPRAGKRQEAGTSWKLVQLGFLAGEPGLPDLEQRGHRALGQSLLQMFYNGSFVIWMQVLNQSRWSLTTCSKMYSKIFFMLMKSIGFQRLYLYKIVSSMETIMLCNNELFYFLTFENDLHVV